MDRSKLLLVIIIILLFACVGAVFLRLGGGRPAQQQEAMQDPTTIAQLFVATIKDDPDAARPLFAAESRVGGTADRVIDTLQQNVATNGALQTVSLGQCNTTVDIQHSCALTLVYQQKTYQYDLLILNVTTDTGYTIENLLQSTE